MPGLADAMGGGMPGGGGMAPPQPGGQIHGGEPDQLMQIMMIAQQTLGRPPRDLQEAVQAVFAAQGGGEQQMGGQPPSQGMPPQGMPFGMAPMTPGMPQGRPIMPEEYDQPTNPIAPHARAFGAGLVDPMGLPSWALDAYTQRWPNASPVEPATSDWYMRRMQEARDESPVAAGVGSSVVPFLLGGGGARLAGELTTREFLEGLPLFMQMGAGVGGLKGSVFPPPTKKRPQASYPPGGAY